MNSKEALSELYHCYSSGWQTSNCIECFNTVIEDLDKLYYYRDLFNTIKKSDLKLEYSGDELVAYFNKIEAGNWREDK